MSVHHFDGRVHYLVIRAAEWEIEQLNLPSGLSKQIGSHEGFDNEVLKVRAAETKAKITIARFVNEVQHLTDKANPSYSTDPTLKQVLNVLLKRLTHITPFDEDEARAAGAWLGTSVTTDVFSEFPPPLHQSPAKFRQRALPHLTDEDEMMGPQEAAANLASYNAEWFAVLTKSIAGNEGRSLFPFHVWCNVSGDGDLWFKEVHPLLTHPHEITERKGFGDKGQSSAADEGEGEEDEEDEEDAAQAEEGEPKPRTGGDITSSSFTMRYPSQLGDLAASEYAKTFIAPDSVKLTLQAEQLV